MYYSYMLAHKLAFNAPARAAAAGTHSIAAAQQNTITISDAPHNVVPEEVRNNIMWRIK